MSDKMIYELRVVCRSDSEQKYPFEIYTEAKYYYANLEDAQAAVPRLAKDYAERDWLNVYHFGIYAYKYDSVIRDPNRDAMEAFIYLPDGRQWIHSGATGVLHNGEVYERITGNRVDLGILQDETSDQNNRCRFLSFACDYNIDKKSMTEIMPCSLPVPEAYVAIMQSKLERYEAVEREVMTPAFGLPYDTLTIYEEDMDNFLYVPASYSGFRYDLFFDCKASYRDNMHPLWFYVAYPGSDMMLLLPITVSHSLTLMWDEYEHLMDDLLVTENLIDFITFNIEDIMALADQQCKPDYFLWNMMRMEDINKRLLMIGSTHNEL